MLRKQPGLELVIGLALCAAAGLGSVALAQAPAAAAPQPVPALWQPQQYDLHYVGFTATYTCSGLEDTVKQLLKVIGASPDSNVAPLGCTRSFDRPDVFAGVTLKFSTLQLADPADASADGAAAKSTAAAQSAEPAAHGKPTMSGTAIGVWRHVVLGPRQPYPFGEGDCELMEQFRDQVLPKFTIRNLQSRIYCVPHQTSSWGLSFDVLSLPTKS